MVLLYYLIQGVELSAHGTKIHYLSSFLNALLAKTMFTY